MRPQSDRLQPLQNKIQEYLASGLKLGWLIDPQNQKVEIYRPQREVEILALPATISGENVLPGFRLEILEF